MSTPTLVFSARLDMQPKVKKHANFKAIPAKSPEVNFARIALVVTAPSPSLMLKKNFEQKLLIYLLAAYFFIWSKTAIAQPNLHRLTPNFLCLIGT